MSATLDFNEKMFALMGSNCYNFDNGSGEEKEPAKGSPSECCG
jgi:hypothetical protein